MIPRKTCLIDPTLCQKLTRFDSPGTRKSRFCLQFRSAVPVCTSFANKINTFPSHQGEWDPIQTNFPQNWVYLTEITRYHGIFLYIRKNLIKRPIASVLELEENRGESVDIGLETNWSSRTRECQEKEVEKSWIWGQIRNWVRRQSFTFWLTDWLFVRSGIWESIYW